MLGATALTSHIPWIQSFTLGFVGCVACNLLTFKSLLRKVIKLREFSSETQFYRTRRTISLLSNNDLRDAWFFASIF